MRKFLFNGSIARTVCLLMGLLFSASLAIGQVTTGSLQGVVKDPNGAVVAGATVKVTNVETGVVRETTTNEEGFYRLTNLPQGENYKVEISGAGFAPAAVEKVVVHIATENNLDVAFTQAGGATASVTVTTEATLIQSTQNQLSTAYTPKQLTQLPFIGLIDNLALLTPGVVTPGDADFTNGVGISANGNRGRSNNFQIDGQDNNDNSVAGPSTFISNAEAIGEYQVITNNFSAEFGRNSGAQINTITKSGTNEFHGSLFEFHRNSRLNARDNAEKKSQQSFQFLADNGFTEFAGLANRYNHPGPFRENRFGGAVGGPIRANKAFFFVTYQGTYFRGEDQTNNLGSAQMTPTRESALYANTRFGTATTAALTSTAIGGGPALVEGLGTFICAPPTIDTTGDTIPDEFQFGPGNVFGQPVTPGFLAPLAVVADASQPGGRRTIFGCEGVRVFPSQATNHQIIGRVDWNFTDKDTFVARYIFDDDDNPAPAVGRFLAGAAFDVPSRTNNLGLTWTRTVSPTFVNEARFNFSRLDVTFGDTSTRPGPGIGFSGRRDEFFNLTLTFGTQNNLPQSRVVDVYQYQDTIATTRGNHALKFGADIRHQKVNNFFLPNFLGTYTFTGGQGTVPAGTFFNFGTNGLNGSARTGTLRAWEGFFLGQPRQINFALGNPEINTTQNDYFFFVQDDWRIRPTLTLNLGLRYEISTTPFNPIIDEINAREADPARAIFNQSFPIETRTATKLPLDKNNFAPRVGFAWSPNFDGFGDRFRDGRTVIRGGFGLAYDPPYFNIVLNTVTAAPFAAAGVVLQTPGAAGSVSFPFLPSTTAQLNTTPGTNGGDPRLFNQTRVDPDFYQPYTMSFNFGVQQELFRNTVLEVRYVGSRIVGQFQTVNGNPDLRFLARAGQELRGDPTAFTHGVLAPAFPGFPAPSAANGFANRPGTNGNGRVDPNFGPIRTRINGASSTYHGMQMRFDTRLRNDLTLTANYTWSKTIDNASEIFSTFGGGQTVAQAQDPFDITTGERGVSAFHQKHVFTANFLYEFPFWKDQRGAVGHVLGGWQLNGILRLGSGRPYTPQNLFATYDTAWENSFVGSGALRPFNGNPNAPIGTLAMGRFTAENIFGYFDDQTGTAGASRYVVFNTLSPGSSGAPGTINDARLVYNDFGIFTQFGVPLSELEAMTDFGTPFGDVGRNTFRGLPNYNVDLAVFKTTKLTENTKLEFRVEAINVLNRRNFGVPDPFTEDAFNGFTVSSFQNPGFNTGANRSMRVGLRFIF